MGDSLGEAVSSKGKGAVDGKTAATHTDELKKEFGLETLSASRLSNLLSNLNSETDTSDQDEEDREDDRGDRDDRASHGYVHGGAQETPTVSHQRHPEAEARTPNDEDEEDETSMPPSYAVIERGRATSTASNSSSAVKQHTRRSGNLPHSEKRLVQQQVPSSSSSTTTTATSTASSSSPQAPATLAAAATTVSPASVFEPTAAATSISARAVLLLPPSLPPSVLDPLTQSAAMTPTNTSLLGSASASDALPTTNSLHPAAGAFAANPPAPAPSSPLDATKTATLPIVPVIAKSAPPPKVVQLKPEQLAVAASKGGSKVWFNEELGKWENEEPELEISDSDESVAEQDDGRSAAPTSPKSTSTTEEPTSSAHSHTKSKQTKPDAAVLPAPAMIRSILKPQSPRAAAPDHQPSSSSSSSSSAVAAATATTAFPPSPDSLQSSGLVLTQSSLFSNSSASSTSSAPLQTPTLATSERLKQSDTLASSALTATVFTAAANSSSTLTQPRKLQAQVMGEMVYDPLTLSWHRTDPREEDILDLPDNVFVSGEETERQASKSTSSGGGGGSPGHGQVVMELEPDDDDDSDDNEDADDAEEGFEDDELEAAYGYRSHSDADDMEDDDGAADDNDNDDNDGDNTTAADDDFFKAGRSGSKAGFEVARLSSARNPAALHSARQPVGLPLRSSRPAAPTSARKPTTPMVIRQSPSAPKGTKLTKLTAVNSSSRTTETNGVATLRSSTSPNKNSNSNNVDDEEEFDTLDDDRNVSSVVIHEEDMQRDMAQLIKKKTKAKKPLFLQEELNTTLFSPSKVEKLEQLFVHPATAATAAASNTDGSGGKAGGNASLLFPDSVPKVDASAILSGAVPRPWEGEGELNDSWGSAASSAAPSSLRSSQRFSSSSFGAIDESGARAQSLGAPESPPKAGSTAVQSTAPLSSSMQHTAALKEAEGASHSGAKSAPLSFSGTTHETDYNKSVASTPVARSQHAAGNSTLKGSGSAAIALVTPPAGLSASSSGPSTHPARAPSSSSSSSTEIAGSAATLHRPASSSPSLPVAAPTAFRKSSLTAQSSTGSLSPSSFFPAQSSALPSHLLQQPTSFAADTSSLVSTLYVQKMDELLQQMRQRDEERKRQWDALQQQVKEQQSLQTQQQLLLMQQLLNQSQLLHHAQSTLSHSASLIATNTSALLNNSTDALAKPKQSSRHPPATGDGKTKQRQHARTRHSLGNQHPAAATAPTTVSPATASASTSALHRNWIDVHVVPQSTPAGSGPLPTSDQHSAAPASTAPAARPSVSKRLEFGNTNTAAPSSSSSLLPQTQPRAVNASDAQRPSQTQKSPPRSTAVKIEPSDPEFESVAGLFAKESSRLQSAAVALSPLQPPLQQPRVVIRLLRLYKVVSSTDVMQQWIQQSLREKHKAAPGTRSTQDDAARMSETLHLMYHQPPSNDALLAIAQTGRISSVERGGFVVLGTHLNVRLDSADAGLRSSTTIVVFARVQRCLRVSKAVDEFVAAGDKYRAKLTLKGYDSVLCAQAGSSEKQLVVFSDKQCVPVYLCKYAVERVGGAGGV